MAHTINGNRTTTPTHLRPVLIRTPQERRAINRLRQRMERAVERILAVLDQIDADPDLEAGGDDEAAGDDEPSLGWTSSTRQLGPNWHGPWAAEADLEQEHDGREPDADSEEEPDKEDAEGGSYGAADQGGVDELTEQLSALRALSREHELTNPPAAARALLEAHGLVWKGLADRARVIGGAL